MDMMNPGKSVSLALVTMIVTILSVPSWAKAPAIDPAAVETLDSMTSYMSTLQKFSVHTDNTLESLLDNGQRIDFDISAGMVVRRPNKIHTERVGEETEQSFFYDGESLTMLVETDADIMYASVPAPATIEEMIDFAREDLGIILPVSDLVYRNAQSIIMKGVTSAVVVGETVIGDMTCRHLAFRRPDIDIQVWIATDGPPLPCKYVVTDTSSPSNVSIVSVMSNWNLSPVATDAMFRYIPAERAKSIPFLPLESGSDR